MRRTLLRSVLAVLTALALSVAGAHWAAAGDNLWIYANCTEGDLTSAGNGGQDNVVVFGSAGFCGLHILNSRFGIAVFSAGQTTTHVLTYNMRSYYLLGKRRSFGMEAVRGTSGTWGVCLMRRPSHKVACGRVEFNEDSGAVHFYQISTDDPLVAATVSGSQVGVDPKCAACF